MVVKLGEKPVPVMVTMVVTLYCPVVGEIDVTVGAVDVYLNAESKKPVALRLLGSTTEMRHGPVAKVGTAAGVVHVMVVELTIVTLVAAVEVNPPGPPPSLTKSPATKFAPVMMMLVPPPVGPTAVPLGFKVTLVTVGGAALLYAKPLVKVMTLGPLV